MRSFTSKVENEPFEIRGEVYILNGDVDMVGLVDVLGRAQAQFEGVAGSTPTPEFVKSLRVLAAELFEAALIPEDGVLFVERLNAGHINLITEALPAMMWVVETLGKLLSGSRLGSASGGTSADVTSTDIALPTESML